MASASNQAEPTPSSNDKAKKEKEYAEFLAKVKRTIYLDNLSPQVTDSVIKTALGQISAVTSITFLQNWTIPHASIPQSALVELESERKAQAVIQTLTDFPFMMSGMPRPVRAQPARAEMFEDRPAPPGRGRIEVRWVKEGDREYEGVKRMKSMVRRHKAEHLELVKLHLKEEENLAKQQHEILMGNYKKYEITDKIVQDGTLPKLASSYNISLD
ncbi:hypothetical protein LUZ60_013694 [Juncus effusus]|nr:hypothetical protein LUZ60_013694 [Juncus effusus]